MTFLAVLLLVFLFFFQAEDGIRDGHVTGVQTCALPILSEVLDRQLPTQVCDTLVPEADLDGLYQQLYSSDCEHLMLVTHQPLVGEFVNDLCGTEPGHHYFGTSTLACIDTEFVAAGMGELLWLRHPLM